jgi:hypothetical protein
LKKTAFGCSERTDSYFSRSPRTSVLLIEKQMFPLTVLPERTRQPKFSAPGTLPHESVIVVYVMFERPTAEKLLGETGLSNLRRGSPLGLVRPSPEYPRVMLIMKN